MKATNGLWEPGTINGRPASMEKELTVFYKMEGTDLNTTAQLNMNEADQLLKEGNFRRAIKLYSKAIELFPTYDFTIYRMGLAKYYSGNLEGAMHDFKIMADLDSHLANPMLNKLSEMADFVEVELQLNNLMN